MALIQNKLPRSLPSLWGSCMDKEQQYGLKKPIIVQPLRKSLGCQTWNSQTQAMITFQPRWGVIFVMTAWLMAREKKIQENTMPRMETGFGRQRRVLQNEIRDFQVGPTKGTYFVVRPTNSTWFLPRRCNIAGPSDRYVFPNPCHHRGHLNGPMWFLYKSWVSTLLKDRYFSLSGCAWIFQVPHK